jgi:hypothetical protein
MTNNKPRKKSLRRSSWIPSFGLGCLIASHHNVASNFGHESSAHFLRSLVLTQSVIGEGLRRVGASNHLA